LDKKWIINVDKAMTHFKIDSEIEHETTLRKRGKMLQNKEKNEGIREFLITFHCIYAEKKRDVKSLR
jgi:hypothetical protein